MDSGALADKNNVVCPVCGKPFHLKPSKIAKDKHHYCSRKCFSDAKREYMRGSGNHQFGLRGAQNASWKGGTKISIYGYRLIRCAGHPFGDRRTGMVFEHRLVAEKYLLTDENSVEIGGKKYLSPDYMVHHKNHNRLDNRPENLEVMKRSAHSRMHAEEYVQIMKRNNKGQFIKQGHIVDEIGGGQRGNRGFGSTGR